MLEKFDRMDSKLSNSDRGINELFQRQMNSEKTLNDLQNEFQSLNQFANMFQKEPHSQTFACVQFPLHDEVELKQDFEFESVYGWEYFECAFDSKNEFSP
ncbi:hypothetical protein DM860_005456 [Cuscuta australis]|uniref:Uncharacterized protein n=1 Tax=Cuscuta australis TaxID=267555 RepID=A0A328E0T7_9ASTE|nr:hypothetical protein DM860_005894 [Cuscuta australis]RAL51100.1 hypothetical protein DM860_005456 [Cuscuta australis]